MTEHKWLSIAGTALSGLGATVNGINSLYGLSVQFPDWSLGDWEAPGHAMLGGLVGSTAALTSGWLTAAKLGGATFTTVGLSAGCVYASVGLIYFLHTVMRLNTDRPPRHAPVEGTPEALEYPSPQWLSTRVLNWGVIGRVGAGKSTLINSLRGLKAQDPDAAPVGVGHTTRRPSPYNFTGDVAVLTRNMARLWDLPGAGTKDWPSATYMRDAGLRHFDGVICVTSGAFSESEAELITQLLTFKVPYYVVRNKVDQDALNNEQDNGTSVQETLAEIRNELVENGIDPSRMFLISAKHPECQDYDFGLLLRAMATDVSMIRSELPEFQEEAVRLLGARRPGQGLSLPCPSGSAAAEQASCPSAASSSGSSFPLPRTPSGERPLGPQQPGGQPAAPAAVGGSKGSPGQRSGGGIAPQAEVEAVPSPQRPVFRGWLG